MTILTQAQIEAAANAIQPMANCMQSLRHVDGGAESDTPVFKCKWLPTALTAAARG